MRNLQVKHKMALLMVVVIIMLLAIGITGIVTADKMAGRSTETYNENLLPISYVTQIRENNRAIESLLLENLLSTDITRNTELTHSIEEHIKINDALLNKLKLISFNDKAVPDKLNEYISLLPNYRAQRDNIIQLGDNNMNIEGYDLFSGAEFTGSREKMFTLLDAAAELLLIDATVHNTDTVAGADIFKLLNIVFITAVWIICILISVVITRLITKPLKDLQGLMKRAEEGNLTAIIVYDSKDEIGIINRSFNSMLGSLRTLMQGVTGSAEMLLASAEEISASAEHTALASRMIAETSGEIAVCFDEQLGSINRTSESVQAIAGDITAVERSSNKMSSLMSVAASSTDRGTDAIHQIMTQMKGMDTSVAQSQEIVSNLGRLSQVVSQAFEEIQNSIKDSTRQTEAIKEAIGHISRKSQDVTEAMNQVQVISNKGVEGIQDTRAASEEQLSDLEEMSASAEYLETLAVNLQNNLSHFSL